MTTAAAEHGSATPLPRHQQAAGYISYDGLDYVPRLPPTSYTLLLHMLNRQQIGGLVRATHEELAEGVAMDRGVISRAMAYLVAARLVRVKGRGKLQIHAMLAKHESAQHRYDAITALPIEERLDVGHFEEEYERRFALHQQEKAEKAEKRKTSTARGHLRSVT
ncbi:hypothetical protein GCM10010260_81720 [Streptomyces filipinensis]|uniref:Uncharacterized protein n=1 Tax=Streptomyces filipinensis TaxID=66887 RepID=A0A918IKG3_9ACTN|nr:winged helix-turn-helix domain-containing protein [Streptomyces filipinensis]GGV28920.1 hypothetical protein GCM10010260_81720 [Streptomyces filipinensis]